MHYVLMRRHIAESFLLPDISRRHNWDEEVKEIPPSILIKVTFFPDIPQPTFSRKMTAFKKTKLDFFFLLFTLLPPTLFPFFASCFSARWQE